MKFSDVSLPEVYKSSQDFRFFLNWFNCALSTIKADTENFLDMYDCLRCPEDLLWLLADTVGYKYDDRLPTAFNRLVILYFMSMIRNRGSKDGMTLAAEVNLAQFNILQQGASKPILYNRLEDTSIPINAVSVTPHVAEGYIDVTYFSTKLPIDACIEYVRPVGMYVFQRAGVRYDARTKISVDAALTDSNNVGMSIGPTHVGHYRRTDYAKLQSITGKGDPSRYDRNPVYNRNSKYEGTTSDSVDPGYRALYSLQLCNNEQIMKSLGLEPIFSLGYGAQAASDRYVENYADYPQQDKYSNKTEVSGKPYNLRYDKQAEIDMGPDVYTVDESTSVTDISPAVNPIMSALGDAIAITDDNTKYSEIDESGNIHSVDVTNE